MSNYNMKNYENFRKFTPRDKLADDIGTKLSWIEHNCEWFRWEKNTGCDISELRDSIKEIIEYAGIIDKDLIELEKLI